MLLKIYLPLCQEVYLLNFVLQRNCAHSSTFLLRIQITKLLIRTSYTFKRTVLYNNKNKRFICLRKVNKNINFFRLNILDCSWHRLLDGVQPHHHLGQHRSLLPPPVLLQLHRGRGLHRLFGDGKSDQIFRVLFFKVDAFNYCTM